MGLYEFNAADAYRFKDELRAETRVRGDELQFKSCPYCRGGNHHDQWTFAINLKTGLHNCQRSSCPTRGNMITLSQDFDFSLGADVDEYYRGVRKYRSIHRKERPITREPAIEYMASRGISEEICREYDITTQKDHDNILVFPFYDENDILTFVKYRKTDFDKAKGDRNKEWCEANCKPILFGMNHIDPENKTLILTEGQIDSLSIAEAGVSNAVSVPTGAKGFTWVPHCWDFMEQFDTLIVFGDHESGRITLLDEMTKRFHGTVKHVRETDYQDCKDANEILNKHGTDAVRKAIAQAVPVPNPHIKRLSEVKRVDISELQRITTGFTKLDKLLGGFFFGQLIILTGQRGEGKSTLASLFGINAMNTDCPTMYYSGELEDWYFKDWLDRQLAGPANITSSTSALNYTNYSVKESARSKIEQWYSELAYLYSHGIAQDEESETETIFQTLEKAVKQYGCRMLIIDNLMTALDDDMANDLYRQQSAFVRRLAQIAKDLDVLIMLIVHPRKTSTEITNDDVLGSSNITNLADVVLNYSRKVKEESRRRKKSDPPEDDAEEDDRRFIRVLKNRLNGKLTRGNGIEVYFDEASKRISEKRDVFDWTYGWETDDDGFKQLSIDDDIPEDLPW